jgi:hypothetical protein
VSSYKKEHKQWFNSVPQMGKKKHSSHKKASRPRKEESFGHLRALATVVPPETFVQLKYVDQFVLNPASGTTDNYVFRANSLFDPNYTGAGHQPYGYDQWATFYSSWCVYRTTLVFTCTPPNLSTVTPQIDNAILYVTKRRTDPSAFADVNTAIEDPYCMKYVMTSGYQKQPRLAVTLDTPSFLGVDKKVYLSSQEYAGATGSNPTIQSYIICGAGSTAAGTNNPDPMYCTAELKFFVKFYNPANLTGSSLQKPMKLSPFELSETKPPTLISSLDTRQDEDEKQA